jgi:hypothetical protein
MKRTATLAISVWLLLTASPLGAQDVMHLAIGDPARKAREAPVVLDAITDTAKGDTPTPARRGAAGGRPRGLRRRATPTSNSTARNCGSSTRAWPDAGADRPRDVPTLSSRSSIDGSGTLTEAQFVNESRCGKEQGYTGAYRYIFRLARDHRRLPAIARPATSLAVRKKGLKNLTAEEAAHIPSGSTRPTRPSAAVQAFFAGSDSATTAR